MTSFLSQTLQALYTQHDELSSFSFILPSKRAGAFLRKEISKIVDKPVFAPGIYSIEEFSETISGISTLNNTTTLFELYTVYKEATSIEKVEDFDLFCNWAQTLIHDFNEIDRYLIPPHAIFNYLAEIQDLNHWSTTSPKTTLVENYLAFWKKLPDYYTRLKTRLLEKNAGYQGLVYRQAAENIEQFARSHASKYIFIGFNALNTAEQVMIQKMLEHGSQIFWDIDTIHFKDPSHDASLFIRQYAQTWPYYQNNPFNSISNSFNTPKNIDIIGIPKSIGQAKYVGEILSRLSTAELESTALVLGDESLLVPVLNSLPKNVPAINITMGYPLKYSPFASLFEMLFQIYKQENESYYYKEVISILSNPILEKLTQNASFEAVQAIKKQNLLYLNQAQILGLFESKLTLIKLLFPIEKLTPGQTIFNLKNILESIKEQLSLTQESLHLEFLFHFHIVFEELEELLNKYTHIKSISSLHQFYKELSALQALDFKGKPFQGLQLMGMLESRALDFETVILTSVDEGVLPAGKSNNSFIPFELKKAFNLPTYKEKDAVYTYHFYHLIQRAKNIYLLHNTDTESNMGGEKSRFLLQLEIEKQSQHTINTYAVTPLVPKVSSQLKEIVKSPEIMAKIKDLAAVGFSPSALTTYIRNPLDFYKQYILGIRDTEEVEETVAYNTLGTVVHQTLEAFYSPLLGHELTQEHIAGFQKRITAEVSLQFENTYSKIPLSKGKNLLIFEVAKRYVSNFLKMESRELKSGKQIVMQQIEANLFCTFPIAELAFPIKIRGTVDRVDLANGILRIIDYKTGKVLQNQLELIDWEDLTTNYDRYAKPFQVLMYASMLLNIYPTGTNVEAGVFSFKNLKEGFLRFATKENSRDKNKNFNIEEATLTSFKKELKKLILEICDPKIPFLEKEIKSYGNF